MENEPQLHPFTDTQGDTAQEQSEPRYSVAKTIEVTGLTPLEIGYFSRHGLIDPTLNGFSQKEVGLLQNAHDLIMSGMRPREIVQALGDKVPELTELEWAVMKARYLRWSRTSFGEIAQSLGRNTTIIYLAKERATDKLVLRELRRRINLPRTKEE